MPIPEWKTYAFKVRKEPKSGVHKYKRASAFRLSRKTECGDSSQQSWEEPQEEERKEVDEKRNEEESSCSPERGREGIQETTCGRQEVEKSPQEKKEEPEVLIDPYGTPQAGAANAVDHISNFQESQVKLRPPIEVYESLDDEIQQHLERVNHGKETETGLRSPIQSSGSVSSEERGIEPSGSSGGNRKKKVRRKKNGEDGSSRPQAQG